MENILINYFFFKKNKNETVANVFIFSFILLGSFGTVYVVSSFLHFYLSGNEETLINLSLSQLIDRHAIEYAWIIKFLINCFGYSCVFIPGIVIYQYTRKTKYLERCGKDDDFIYFKEI